MYKNSAELFGGNHLRTTNLDKHEWTDLFLPQGSQYYNTYWNGGSGNGCAMQRPGFNTQCNDNNWARWGYCGNLPAQPCQSSDGSDADFALGIGLKLQNYPNNINAPFDEYFLHGHGNGVVNSHMKQAWLFVKAK